MPLRPSASLPHSRHRISPAGDLWVAWAGDTEVGCVALHGLTPDIAELKRMYVRPEARGRGVARKLTEHAIANAAARGYRRLRLGTLTSAHAAQQLYTSLGFRPDRALQVCRVWGDVVLRTATCCARGDMTSTSVNGITIGFEEMGDGDNALLLVHGHPFNRSMWDPQLGPISDAGRRVVAPDLRGYGESTVVPGKTPLDVFAADLAALLDHLDIADVVIGGLSMGGQIAMGFARQYPDRLRGLMLAATFAHTDTDEGKRKRNAMAERLVREGMGEYADSVLSQMLAPRSIVTKPAVAEHVSAMMHATNPEGAAAALRGRSERPSYIETLANLKVPALVVVGSEDAFTTSPGRRADARSARGLGAGLAGGNRTHAESRKPRGFQFCAHSIPFQGGLDSYNIPLARSSPRLRPRCAMSDRTLVFISAACSSPASLRVPGSPAAPRAEATMQLVGRMRTARAAATVAAISGDRVLIAGGMTGGGAHCAASRCSTLPRSGSSPRAT